MKKDNQPEDIIRRLNSFDFLNNADEFRGRDIFTQNSPFRLQTKKLDEYKRNSNKEFNQTLKDKDNQHINVEDPTSREKEVNEKKIKTDANNISGINRVVNPDNIDKDKQLHDIYNTQHENLVRSFELLNKKKYMSRLSLDDDIIISDRLKSRQINGLLGNRTATQRNLQLLKPEENREPIKERDDENKINKHTIRLSINATHPTNRSLPLDKKPNDSLINIVHYEIQTVDDSEKVDLSKEIDNFLVIATTSTDNFKLISHKEAIMVYQKHNEKSPVVLVRCDATVKGNVETVFDAIFNLEKRSQWDTILSRLKIVKVFDECTDVMYSYLKTPPLVSNRDFLQKRSFRRNINGFDIVMAFVSYEDKDFPPVKGAIRANTLISGYAFEKLNESTTRLITISQTDIKGSIPTRIINRTAAKAPYDWVKRLEKAVNDIENGKLK